MKSEHIQYLRCPTCGGSLTVSPDCRVCDGVIREGALLCACGQQFSVVKSIPRFVPSENYAESFGFEWLQHARTQYDEESGERNSERRFFAETQWGRDLSGEVLLEVGSGSGRFTHVAAETGAMVVSLDYSPAVEANYASNGMRNNVLIVQGDLYRMPFPRAFFDRLFCLGVLQHTPDVEAAFKTLPAFVRPGGHIAIDCYAKMRGFIPFFLRLTSTHYRIRSITKRMDHRRLYTFCCRYITAMWPLAKRIGTIPRMGPFLLRRLCIPPYFGVYDLSDEKLREWMILDMFDALSPAYDQPQFLDVVESWFHKVGLQQVEVVYGYNGINGRGTVPLQRAEPH